MGVGRRMNNFGWDGFVHDTHNIIHDVSGSSGGRVSFHGMAGLIC